MECSTNTSAGDSGPICMWDFYHCSLRSCMPLPSHHLRWMSLSPTPFSSLLCPPPPLLLTHPSSLYLTGDKVWASSWLANQRPVILVNIFSEPCQASSGRTRPYRVLTKGTDLFIYFFYGNCSENFQKFCHSYPSDSTPDMDHPRGLSPTNLLIKRSSR